ncbi:Transmembrane 42 protein [Rutstroemia sp. NJR-2017a BBW]|nr:Transmembrane 42 protein [Rutstroemia sp. NJR-2017a BBW]
MQRLSKRRTNKPLPSNPNDSAHGHTSLTTSINFGPTSSPNMDHSRSAPDDPRQPLLDADAAGAGVDSMRLNHDTAKENHSSMVNKLSYGATTSPSSQHSITRGADDEEDDEEVRLEVEETDTAMENISRKSQWILLAVASGACAAFNGVFAKLTTTQLTTSFAESVASFFGLGEGEKVVEYGVRGIFFLLNLIFNGIMWTLFTKALARGTSTVQVSIINTSSNFMITAVLGFIIFSESLPPLWFVGAALLVAGNVIIGRREEEEKDKGDLEGGRAGEEGDGLLGEELELGGSVVLEPTEEGKRTREREREREDVLDLALDEEEGKSSSEDDILLL